MRVVTNLVIRFIVFVWRQTAVEKFHGPVLSTLLVATDVEEKETTGRSS